MSIPLKDERHLFRVDVAEGHLALSIGQIETLNIVCVGFDFFYCEVRDIVLEARRCGRTIAGGSEEPAR